PSLTPGRAARCSRSTCWRPRTGGVSPRCLRSARSAAVITWNWPAMPDFFDRLVARGSPDGPAPGSDAGAAGAPSYLENRAGIIRARPRLPGPFERPARPSPHDVLEITESPASPRPRAPDGTAIHP